MRSWPNVLVSLRTAASASSIGIAPLGQTMSNQSGRAFEELLILVGKCIHFIALGIEHPDDVLMLVLHGNDDLGLRAVKRRKITLIFVHIADHDRFSRLERRPAQALTNWKTWISHRLVAGPGQNDKLVFHDLVDGDEPVIARRPDHFCDLLHTPLGAAACQDKCSNLLKLF